MVRTYDELIEEQAQAAVRVMGAHHTSWNRQVKLLDDADPSRGRVSWDHTINYHPAVLNDLREMFATAGRHHDADTLKRYREALRVVFHENIHLLAARGTSHAMGFHAYQQPANEVVEEAITELATQQSLNKYIAELGLEEIAPGISSAQPRSTYGEYVPALASFTEEIGDETRLPQQEVVRRLAVVNAEDKLRVAAELLYDAKVGELAPAQARAGGVASIVESMEPAFAGIHGYDPDDPQDVGMSGLAGLHGARQAVLKVEELRRFWENNQELRRSLDAGLGPSTPARDQPPRESGLDDTGGREVSAGRARPSGRAAGDGRRPESGDGRAARPPRMLGD